MGFGNYLIPGLSLAGAAIKGKQASEEKQRQSLMQQIQMTIDEQKRAEETQFKRTQMRHMDAQTSALGQPKPSRRTYDAARGAVVDEDTGVATPVSGLPKPTQSPDRVAHAFVVDGKPTMGFSDKSGKFYDSEGNPISGKVTPFSQPVTPSYTPVTVGDGVGGQVVKPFDTKTGETGPPIGTGKPAGGGLAGPALQKAVATNQQQLFIIEDALKELGRYPDAVGLKRGLPYIGDKLDQRADPKGVPARASIANIGSLQIHTRTGAAMSAREEPRLSPFVPSVSDTPETIRTKLTKLREAIQVETGYLMKGGSGGESGTKGTPPLSDADKAHATRDPSFARWLRDRGYEVP